MHSPALLQPPHTHHPAAPPTWPQLGAWRPPAGGVAAAAAGSWCVAAGVGGVGTRPGLAAATARARLPPCSASTDLQHAAAAQSTTINTTQHRDTQQQAALGRGPLPGACAVASSLTCQMSPGQGCPAQGGHITDNASPPPMSPQCLLLCPLPPICTITTTPHRLFGHRDRNYSSIQLQDLLQKYFI